MGSDPRTVVIIIGLALSVSIGPACHPGSELSDPDDQTAQRIRSAVQAFVDRRGREDDALRVRDVARSEERSVTLEALGEPRTLRSRYYVVPAKGRTDDGEAIDLTFFVLENGPVLVVDTVVIADPRDVRFAP